MEHLRNIFFYVENKDKTKTKRVFGTDKLHQHTSPQNFIMFREVQDEYQNDL